jgi:NTE family protein
VQLVTRDDPLELEAGRQVIYDLEESLKENFDVDKVQVLVRAGPWGDELSYDQINSAIDFDVYTKLPDVEADDMMKMLISSQVSMPLLDADSDYAQIVRKRARELGDVLVGLVLGGGAALGIAHIGILRVLERERIPVDVVVGSSMGALIGSFWVTGRRADQIERLAREFESKKGMFKLLDPVVPISGFIGGQAIKSWLRRHLGGRIFYDTTIPFKVVAYDIIKRQEIVVNSGPLVDAVAQSIAIPGVINPVREQNKVIIDGGVLNPLPVNVLKDLGINKIIAVNVLQSPDDVTAGFLAEQQAMREQEKIPFARSPFRYLGVRIKKAKEKFFMPNISDIIVRSLQASEYLIAEQSGQEADVLIHPDLVGLNWYELYRVDELIKRGEAAAEKHLNAIRRLVEE